MNKSTHHPLIIFFHWFSFTLILGALLLIEIKNYVPSDNPWRTNLTTYHMLLGQTILLVVLLRIITRLFVINPIEQEKTVSRVFKKMMHACLYIFMLAMPVSGIMLMQSAGNPIPYFGDLYPALTQVNIGLAKAYKYIHIYLGNAIYLFIGAHAIMAIWREYVMKDGPLQKMLLPKATRAH
jgi:cytochrome b561